jgi:hypothetical protein
VLLLYVHVHTALLAARRRARHHAATRRSEAGQTSAEYALVLLGAASVAVLVAVWARKTNRVGGLLDTVFEHVVSMVG